MNPTDGALFAYVTWTILLVVALGLFRSGLVMTKGRAANSFAASGDDLDGFGKRLTRAHANCFENLPAAAAIMLYAIATDQTAITNGLAYPFIAARLAQSVVHLISTSRTFVLVRFAFYIVQLVILIYWMLKLAGHI